MLSVNEEGFIFEVDNVAVYFDTSLCENLR